MGRATRWLTNLWGGKKEQEKIDHQKKDKRRWSLGKTSGKASAMAPESWATSYREVFFTEAEKGRSKHAIIVAAATVAAAAATVIGLTSQSRNSAFPGNSREHSAATKIQTTFRGYLARKALRALKGLVKLQAHVRGYLVRKEATATLYSMRDLFRAQAKIRKHQSRSSGHKNSMFHHEACARRSMERFHETRRKNVPSIHNRRLISRSIENGLIGPESPKIVEINTFRPKLRLRQKNLSASESIPLSPPYEQSGFHPPIIPASSPLVPVPVRQSIPANWSFDPSLLGDGCRFSTAESTPRLSKSIMHDARPATPTAKNVYGDGFRRGCSGSPNYMANTQSFRAKVRSQSVPKQRPDPPTKRRLSLQEAVEARSSLSGFRMQRSSSSKAQEPLGFKHAVVNGFDPSIDADSCLDGDYLVSLRNHQ